MNNVGYVNELKSLINKIKDVWKVKLYKLHYFQKAINEKG